MYDKYLESISRLKLNTLSCERCLKKIQAKPLACADALRCATTPSPSTIPQVFLFMKSLR